MWTDETPLHDMRFVIDEVPPRRRRAHFVAAGGGALGAGQRSGDRATLVERLKTRRSSVALSCPQAGAGRAGAIGCQQHCCSACRIADNTASADGSRAIIARHSVARNSSAWGSPTRAIAWHSSV